MELEGAHELGGRVYRSAPPSDAVRRQLLDEGVAIIDTPDEGTGGPSYYGEVLRRAPGQITSVFAQIADAPAGDVLLSGDRTSLIGAMLHTLVNKPVADILDDYELSLRTTNDAMTSAELDALSADHCLALVAFLGSTDIPGYLTASGLTFDQLDRLRERLLGV
jgi:hypothetical protein